MARRTSESSISAPAPGSESSPAAIRRRRVSSEYLNTNYQMITGLFELLPLKQIFPVMAGAAMALGVGIGAIVSFLTIQRHLRV